MTGRPSPRPGTAALRLLFRLGWRTAHRIPAPLVAGGHRRAGPVRGALPGAACADAAPQPRPDHRAGRWTTDLARAAVRSHLRNVYEMLALPGWPPAEVLSRIETVNEARMRAAYASTGAVIALPHSGNWDLAGAYAELTGMPVTTVAEELAGPEFAAFVAFRERLGMQVLSHRDPAVIGELIAAVRAGRLVCLLADRDLAGRGVPVRWAGRPITMPAGPALVARRTGAALIPIVCQFTPRGMRIVYGDPVPHRPGRDGLVAMVQEVADFFVQTIATQPEDWHMMQPFFAAEDAATSTRPSPTPSVPSRRALRVGLVCPYSLESPGGVQSHVLGLTRHLLEQGHEPFVLAPGGCRPPGIPRWTPAGFDNAGTAVPLRYNGSVARVSFGPLSAARVRRWLAATASTWCTSTSPSRPASPCWPCGPPSSRWWPPSTPLPLAPGRCSWPAACCGQRRRSCPPRSRCRRRRGWWWSSTWGATPWSFPTASGSPTSPGHLDRPPAATGGGWSSSGGPTSRARASTCCWPRCRQSGRRCRTSRW